MKPNRLPTERTMTPLIAQHNTQTDLPSFPTTAVRKIYFELLDRLAKTLANLNRAKCLLSNAIENGNAVQYESTRFDVEKLRADCSDIRLELAWCHAQQDQPDQFG